MIRINLLAADRKTTTKPKSSPTAIQAYLLLVVFGGGAALACVAAYWIKSSQIQELDTKIEAANKRLDELKKIKEQVDALEAKRNLYQKKVDLIEKLNAQRTGPTHMLDEVSKALPELVWLTSLDNTGANVNLGGASNGYNAVADYIAALQRSGWFSSVELRSLTGDQIAAFALGAVFKNPETIKPAATTAPAAPPPAATPSGAPPAPKK